MEWRSPGPLPTKLPPPWLEGSPALLCNLVFGKLNHHVGVKHINMIAQLQFLLLYIPMIPESPRWLVSKGRTSAALDVLMSIARVNKLVSPEVITTTRIHWKIPWTVTMIVWLNHILNNLIVKGGSVKSWSRGCLQGSFRRRGTTGKPKERLIGLSCSFLSLIFLEGLSMTIIQCRSPWDIDIFHL